MDEYTTQRRMRSHIVITLCVLWAISMHYGAGFSIVTLGPMQIVVPNWATFLVLGIGIVAVQRYRDQVLTPIAEWMGWVLAGEYEHGALTDDVLIREYEHGVDDGIDGTLALFGFDTQPTVAVTERIERY